MALHNLARPGIGCAAIMAARLSSFASCSLILAGAAWAEDAPATDPAEPEGGGPFLRGGPGGEAPPPRDPAEPEGGEPFLRLVLPGELALRGLHVDRQPLTPDTLG